MFKLLIFLLLLVEIFCTEWFTSTVHMEGLLDDKLETAHILESYVSNERLKLQRLKEVVEEMKVKDSNAEDFIAHPINQFILLRSMKPQYFYIHNLLNASLTETLRNEFKMEIERLPDQEDVNGAAEAIVRIQKTYNLSAHDIADGVIFNSVAATNMSADDCYLIGHAAFGVKKYYQATLWLMEAKEKWLLGDKSASRFNIFNILGRSLAKQGNFYHGIGYLDKAIELAENETLLEDLYKAQRQMRKKIRESEEEIPKAYEEPILKPVEYSQNSSIPLYESLCRGEVHPVSPAVEKKLKCYIWHNNKNWIKIQPFKIEELWKSPHIVRFYDILEDFEIRKLIRIATPMLERSSVVSKGKKKEGRTRISKSTWLEERYGDVIAKVNDRITDLTGLKTRYHAEYLQLANYGVGGHFTPHLDRLRDEYTNGSKSLLFGDRIATMLLYLSDVIQGGSTIFLYPKIAVKPIKGSAIFWFNLLASGVADERTKHAGCPVAVGTKWISNKWIHEFNQDTTYPCHLDETADNRLFT